MYRSRERNRRRIVIIVVAGVIGVALVCALPGILSNLVASRLPPRPTKSPTPVVTQPAPTQTPTPTQTPFPFPPDLLADPNSACFMYGKEYSTKGITCLDQAGWHFYDNPLIQGTEHIIRCPDGRIYLDGERSYQVQDGVPVELKRGQYGSVRSIACGPGEEIWAVVSGENQGIGNFDGVDWIVYPNDFLGKLYDIDDIALSPDGDVWVSAKDRIGLYDGSDWQVFQPSDRIDYHWETLKVDAHGNLWAPLGSEMWSYAGGQWVSFDTDVVSQAITFDAEQRVLMGTRRFDPATGAWDTPYEMDQLNLSEVNALQFDQRGRLWVASDYGIHVFDGADWTSYHMHTAAALQESHIEDLIVLGDGPDLPALESTILGSVTGTRGPWYGGMQVELCLDWVFLTVFFGESPCKSQPFHQVTTVDAAGNFEFKDVPRGRYYLAVQLTEDYWKMKSRVVVESGRNTDLGHVPDD
jgi:hypothetical protein